MLINHICAVSKISERYYDFNVDMSEAKGSCCGEYFPAGPNQQPVLRDYFECRGDEDSLSECPRAVGGVCDHTQDVSVICS